MARPLLVNAVMSVAQVIVTGLAYFVLYRFLLDAVGVELLGVWSVVLATTNVGRLSNLGLNASVVKFVAQYLARGERQRAVDVLETAAISLGALLAVFVVVLYPFARVALGWFIEDAWLEQALILLPWALGSLWMSVLASVFQSGLDGLQRIDLRAIIMMGTTILYVALCWYLVPDHGILGLAWAQVAQVGTLLVINSLLLRRLIPEMPLVPHRFQRSIFKELVGYGVQVQLMTVGSLMLEPVAKGLIARYGGVATAGWFEMANRLVIQLRQLINGAAQAIVPTVAHQKETAADTVNLLYKSTYRTLFFVVFPALAFTVGAIPWVSELWVGHYEPTFVVMAYILAVGLYLGMLSSPAFFTNLGTGDLIWNTIATLVMLALTAIPVLATGGAIGGLGVAICYALAFIVGGAIILGGFHRSQQFPLREALPRESLPVLLAAPIAALLPLAVYYSVHERLGLVVSAIIGGALWAAVLAWPIWQHPMRARLFGLVRRLTGR